MNEEGKRERGRIGEEKENEIEESENDKGKESKWNRKRMINRRKGG